MSEKITLQTIFDAAWQGFIVEGRKPGTRVCAKGAAGCFYQVPNNPERRCAVGLALPDDEEILGFEEGFGELVEKFPELFDEGLHDLGAELNVFQDLLHDNLINTKSGEFKYSRAVLRDKYVKVAKIYGLKVPEGDHE